MAKAKKTRAERKWFGRILYDIGEFFKRLNPKVKKIVGVAINIVEGIKEARTDVGVNIILEILKKVIKGDKDDKIIEKAKEAVDKYAASVLLELAATDAILAIEDRNEQLRLIMERIKGFTHDSRKILLHGLASLILEKLADGKLTWSEATQIAEYYFQNILNNPDYNPDEEENGDDEDEDEDIEESEDNEDVENQQDSN